MKIKAEISETETKKTIEKINETKSLSFEKIKLTNCLLDHEKKREGSDKRRNNKDTTEI